MAKVIRNRTRPNPRPKFAAAENARSSRECERAIRETQDVAADADEKIKALATAHYESCETCQTAATESRIQRLRYAARERAEDYCGGVL